MTNIEQVLVLPDATIEAALATIQRGCVGIALVVDSDRRLLDTVTDGDIRRAILNKVPLSHPVSILRQRRSLQLPTPVVATAGTAREHLIVLMRQHRLRQIPLLDAAGRVVDLAVDTDFMDTPLSAVVMAGGLGQRLRPLTAELPKPMLPFAERPLMERTILQLKNAGVHNVAISTHYKAEAIRSHFGDGSKFGVAIDYIHEELPLGTAGALGLMDVPSHPTLIINGDIVTELDFRVMLEFHQSHEAAMTVAVRTYEFKIPYGVIEADDVFVLGVAEKPVQTVSVNAGIYLVEPRAYRFIPKSVRLDMTDLITRLLSSGERVIRFPIQEYWLDIGQHEDYKQATEDARQGKLRISERL